MYGPGNISTLLHISHLLKPPLNLSTALTWVCDTESSKPENWKQKKNYVPGKPWPLPDISPKWAIFSLIFCGCLGGKWWNSNMPGGCGWACGPPPAPPPAPATDPCGWPGKKSPGWFPGPSAITIYYASHNYKLRWRNLDRVTFICQNHSKKWIHKICGLLLLQRRRDPQGGVITSGMNGVTAGDAQLT